MKKVQYFKRGIAIHIPKSNSLSFLLLAEAIAIQEQRTEHPVIARYEDNKQAGYVRVVFPFLKEDTVERIAEYITSNNGE